MRLSMHWNRARAAEVSQAAGVTDVLMSGLNALLGLVTPGRSVGLDVSRVTFTVTRQNAADAVVHVQGETQIVVGAQFEPSSADGDLIMRYEDGRWKWCGFVGE